MDILKEMDKDIAEKREVAEDLTTQAKQLLLTAENKERDALVSAGLDRHIKEIDTTRGVEIEREQFEAKYGNRVLHADEIKALCVKYNLRFLNTHYFNGKVDAQTGMKVAKLMADHKTEMGRDNSDLFYVLAPPRAFALREKPKKVVDLDPILFYKIPGSGGQYYTYVHKWGEDFTIMRKFSGWLFKSVTNMILMPFLFATAVGQVVFFGFAHHLCPWSLLTLIPAAIATVIFNSNFGNGNPERALTERVWNEDTKRSNLFW